MTTSRSHRPCLKIAIRYAAGIPTKIASAVGRKKTAHSHVGERLFGRAEEQTHGEQQEDAADAEPRQCRRRDQPPHLLSFLAAGAPEALPRGDDRREARAEHHEHADTDERIRGSTVGEERETEGVRVEDPVLDEVVQRSGRQGEGDHRESEPDQQRPGGPAPPRAGWTPVREEQDEERDERHEREGVFADKRHEVLTGERVRRDPDAVDDVDERAHVQRDRHGAGAEDPSCRVPRLARHDQRTGDRPGNRDRRADQGEDEIAGRDLAEPVAGLGVAEQLRLHLGHPRCVRVSDHDDVIARGPVAGHEHEGERQGEHGDHRHEDRARHERRRMRRHTEVLSITRAPRGCAHGSWCPNPASS